MIGTLNLTLDEVRWVRSYRKWRWPTPYWRRVWRHARFLRCELWWLRWARREQPALFAFYISHNDTDGRLRKYLETKP